MSAECERCGTDLRFGEFVCPLCELRAQRDALRAWAREARDKIGLVRELMVPWPTTYHDLTDLLARCPLGEP